MCRCLWTKTRSNRDKFGKSRQFCGSDFGSRFPAPKMGVKFFYKKKLKGILGRLHFWEPFLASRFGSQKFFVFHVSFVFGGWTG